MPDSIPVRREWTVDGVTREALVYVPPQAKTLATPVILAFHGHGGTMGAAATGFAYHNCWPAALVVYMQGINTPGALYDPEGKFTGWQSTLGGQGDRDLKFVDAVLATLRQEWWVDDKRIYATGHSNGGFFTYVLWAARADVFAAVAPCAAFAGKLLPHLKPKPALHLAGQGDLSVKFDWQQETLEGLRKLNECGEGQRWKNEEWCTLYPSKVGAPLVTYIHSGAHDFPAGAATAIVKFFQDQARD